MKDVTDDQYKVELDLSRVAGEAWSEEAERRDQSFEHILYYLVEGLADRPHLRRVVSRMVCPTTEVEDK